MNLTSRPRLEIYSDRPKSHPFSFAFSVVLWLLCFVLPCTLRAGAAPDYVWVSKAGGSDAAKVETIGTAAVSDGSGNVFVAGLLNGPSAFGTNIVGAGSGIPVIFV